MGKNLYLRIVERACGMKPCKHAMTNADVQKVRSHLASLEADAAEALRRRRRRRIAARVSPRCAGRRCCWSTTPSARQQIDLLVQHAKELFRGGDAADGVKHRLDAALAACSARLDMVEGGYGKRWRDLRAALSSLVPEFPARQPRAFGERLAVSPT